MNIKDARKFAYAAYLAASKSRAGAIEGLNQIILNNYTTVTGADGKVMVQATATNKSFTFQIAQGLGPKEIGDMAFDAVRLLAALTDDNVEAALLRFSQSSAIVRFC